MRIRPQPETKKDLEKNQIRKMYRKLKLFTPIVIGLITLGISILIIIKIYQVITG